MLDFLLVCKRFQIFPFFACFFFFFFFLLLGICSIALYKRVQGGGLIQVSLWDKEINDNSDI